jgi:predicted transcriptional regulator
MAERLQINIRIDEATEQRLELLARELSIPRASVVRLAIAEFARQRGVTVPAEQAPPTKKAAA